MPAPPPLLPPAFAPTSAARPAAKEIERDQTAAKIPLPEPTPATAAPAAPALGAAPALVPAATEPSAGAAPAPRSESEWLLHIAVPAVLHSALIISRFCRLGKNFPNRYG